MPADVITSFRVANAFAFGIFWEVVVVMLVHSGIDSNRMKKNKLRPSIYLIKSCSVLLDIVTDSLASF